MGAIGRGGTNQAILTRRTERSSVTSASQRKGDQAERDAASVITDLLGFKIERRYGAGRADDVGDLWGVPGHVIQVAWWPHDTLAAFRRKPDEAESQREIAGVPHAATWVRMVGGLWRVALTPQQWATYVRETL